MTNRRPVTVLYDDACPLCTFQMRLLTWLDWFNVARFRPVSDPATCGLVPGLTRAALLEAIHGVTEDGRVYRGARCLRHLGLRIPLLAPVAALLWLPGVIWAAERVYQRVSNRRHLLSRLFGCREACALLPERTRDERAETGG
jgi:predicted DCC family thiol-disulfide oxidoreductase YuxK